MHLFIYAFVWKKEKLHYISYTNFIWSYKHPFLADLAFTGWMGLQLSVILTDCRKIQYVSGPLQKHLQITCYYFWICLAVILDILLTVSFYYKYLGLPL